MAKDYSNVTQPTDSKGNPIPVLSIKPSSGQKITTGAVSARNATALPSTTKVVSIYATQDAFIELGNSTVVATTSSFFLPRGVLLNVCINDGDDVAFTHIAAIQDTAAGSVYISERV